ncbi:hypothetical protein [Yersinia phage fHe-Yen9-03]|uniref:Uncharacterized protein n=1 Tax=Yersinia phage fHe-Yen9-03 TaxID=2052743 RepID=A0A2C9CZP9_9CAUD|nr:hypothetical protein [Yersinia phage fHe-Yen9-03]
MNKKAKTRIFNTVIETSPDHCKYNFWYHNMLRKTILLMSKGKYRKTEKEIIQILTRNHGKKRYNPTPEEHDEMVRLEQSVGLMCGVK